MKQTSLRAGWTALVLVLACAGVALGATDIHSVGSAASEVDVTFENGSPRILLVTDYYTYGASPFPNEPASKLWVDPNGFDENVVPYLYVVNRVTMAERFLTLDTATGNLVSRNTETPLFGVAGDPILAPTPDLSGGVDLFGPGSIFGSIPGLDTSTGHYALVFELRNEAGRVISRDNAMYSYIDAVVPREGTLPGSETWTSNNAYLITDQVFVGAGDTLTIQPGTVVFGDGTAPVAASVGVLQGGSINANCSEFLPCRFTSALERSQRQTQDFGGLIVNGFAPTNQGLNPPPQGEGFTGPYGGNNPADSSGIMRYLVVEYAGQRFNAEDELNCIALQGVGTGTVFENIQCSGGSDDGIEWFGGTVGGTNLMADSNEDDQFDWTFGWNGTVTNLCALHRVSPPGGSDDANQCIEADNDNPDNEAEPRSNPTITNFTCIKGPGSSAPNGEGLRLRRGTSVQLANAVVANVSVNDDATSAVWIDGASSVNQLTTGAMTLDVVVDGVPAGAVSDPVGAAGVMTGNSFLADGAHPLQPQLAPRNGARGCTTRTGDWTTGFWLNWDVGQGN
ncbi:MAG: hypothetical protein DWQ36_25215 [Acidobacteria bacterium]|nr:MAG: hypothetical protein DWQ30_02175 [Acidobacteriota bacterium]REJ99519.1 MAG: hypothetical protein DWQ36_25215 [Acidobacteriota bacterium]